MWVREGSGPRRQQDEPCKSLQREQIPRSRSPLVAGLGRIRSLQASSAPENWEQPIPFPVPHFPPVSRDGLGKLSVASGPHIPFRMCAASPGGISLPVPRRCREVFERNPQIRKLQPKRFSPKMPTRFQGIPFPLLFSPAPRLQRCRRPREDTLLPPTSPAHRGWGKISLTILQGATGTHTSERRASKKQYVYPPAVPSHLFRQQAAL